MAGKLRGLGFWVTMQPSRPDLAKSNACKFPDLILHTEPTQCCYGNKVRLVEVKGINRSFTSRDDWEFPVVYLCSKSYWERKDYQVSGSLDFAIVSNDGDVLIYPHGAPTSEARAFDKTRGQSYPVITGKPEFLMTLSEYQEAHSPST